MSQSPISRRQLLKVLAAAAGTAVLSSVPNKWKTPVVDVGMLPAHAQTLSGVGAVSGTVTLSIPVGSPSSAKIIAPTITITIVSTAFSTMPSYDHIANGLQYFTYSIMNVPAGTYTVRCNYCSVDHDVTGVVVHAGATTNNVDFGPLSYCVS